MNDNICIVFSEWRQQAAGPMSFEETLERPTGANTRTAMFEMSEDERLASEAGWARRGPDFFNRALTFKRAVESGTLTPAVWEQTGAQEI